MNRPVRVEDGSRLDYLAVGHVTIDALPDGTRRPGGTAFYAALQASRLGARAAILTRGVPEEVEAALEPFRDELGVEIEPAPCTTTLATAGSGSTRSQRVLAWAGPISARPVEASVLHLAPVADELAAGWREASAGFIGLTPQGLARRWRGTGGQIVLTPPGDAASELAARCDALVLSELELESCSALLDAALGAGASVAITAGANPTRLLTREGTVALEVSGIGQPVDDIGAGDVFAAAFFLALAEGMPPVRAGGFAQAAAALRVEGPGAGSIARRAAVEERAGRDRPRSRGDADEGDAGPLDP